MLYASWLIYHGQLPISLSRKCRFQRIKNVTYRNIKDCRALGSENVNVRTESSNGSLRSSCLPMADTISRKSKPAKFKDNEAARNKKPTRSDNATLTFYPDSFTTPSSSTAPTRSYCQQSFLSPDNPCSIAEDTASGPDFHPNSSKNNIFRMVQQPTFAPS